MTDDLQTPVADVPVAQDAPAEAPAPEAALAPEAAPAAPEAAPVSAPVAEVPAEALSPAAETLPPAPEAPAIPDEVEIDITETIVIHNPAALRGIPAGPPPHPRSVN